MRLQAIRDQDHRGDHHDHHCRGKHQGLDSFDAIETGYPGAIHGLVVTYRVAQGKSAIATAGNVRRLSSLTMTSLNGLASLFQRRRAGSESDRQACPLGLAEHAAC